MQNRRDAFLFLFLNTHSWLSCDSFPHVWGAHTWDSRPQNNNLTWAWRRAWRKKSWRERYTNALFLLMLNKCTVELYSRGHRRVRKYAGDKRKHDLFTTEARHGNVSQFWLVMSVTIVVFQLPTILWNTYTRFTATNQQPHLSMGWKERRRRRVKVKVFLEHSGDKVFIDLTWALLINKAEEINVCPMRFFSGSDWKLCQENTHTRLMATEQPRMCTNGDTRRIK